MNRLQFLYPPSYGEALSIQKKRSMANKMLDRSPRRSVSNFGDRVGGGSVNMVVELNRFANRIQSRFVAR